MNPTSPPLFSLIIAVYTNIDFLSLVLTSLTRQSLTDFEVIVAEDNDSPDMARFIKERRAAYPVPLFHVSQPDTGFRKNRILNQAVRMSRGKYLVFIDGDCIVHRHFIREYARRIHPKICLFGRRVELDEITTRTLAATGRLGLLAPWRLVFTKSRRKEDCLLIPFRTSWRTSGIWGCNFCVSREDLYAINGFDEEYTRPLFGEDFDVERRLKLIGTRFLSTRQKTIVYHLFHQKPYKDDDWKISKELYREKERQGLPYCVNGIENRPIS